MLFDMTAEEAYERDEEDRRRREAEEELATDAEEDWL